MTKIVELVSVRKDRETSQEALWQRFVELQARSKETGALEDGIAAGKAYAAWCESFVGRRA